MNIFILTLKTFLFLFLFFILFPGIEHFNKNKELAQNSRMNIAKTIKVLKEFEQTEYQEFVARHRVLEQM
jgi:hypothetical protein